MCEVIFSQGNLRGELGLFFIIITTYYSSAVKLFSVDTVSPICRRFQNSKSISANALMKIELNVPQMHIKELTAKSKHV